MDGELSDIVAEIEVALGGMLQNDKVQFAHRVLVDLRDMSEDPLFPIDEERYVKYLAWTRSVQPTK